MQATKEVEKTDSSVPGTDEHRSVNEETIRKAKAAGNTWNFDGRDLEMYVARGESTVGTSILNRKTGKETGSVMLHNFGWNSEAPFVQRESSFKTKLRRVGRSQDQDVDTSHLVTVDASFYSEVIQSGKILTPKNDSFDEVVLSKEQMLHHAQLFPESASEAVETWLESPTIELYEDYTEGDFTYLFEASDIVNVLFKLGNPDYPVAAAILSFSAPDTAVRREYEKTVQKIKSKREGDVSIAELEENFMKKLAYGSKHLKDVKGVAVETEGQVYNEKLKSKFITLFNPIWFVECTEVMHNSFDFMKGRSEKS